MTSVRWAPRLVTLTVVAYAALWCWYALTLPERVPGHLGADGQVTRWDSKVTLLAITAGLGLLAWLCFALAPRWLGRIAGHVNVPHAEYWRRPENVPQMVRLVREDMAVAGAATMVLLGWMLNALARAAHGSPPAGAELAAGTAVYVIAAIGWAAWLYAGRRYRVPPRVAPMPGADGGADGPSWDRSREAPGPSGA